MKTINIFVACSPSSEILNDQKTALIEFCRKLNTTFALELKDFYIKPIPYDNLERRIELFEKHIKNDDIVIFLVDNERDVDLVSELNLAMECSNNFHKPEVLVFASDKIKENKKYDNEIKQICANGGWLYEPLKNTEDLIDNVKEKIFRYVRSYKSIKELRRWSKARYYGLRYVLPILVLLSFYLGMENWNLNKQIETKRLLIVGGGSARNFIEDSLLKQKKGLSTEYWLYAPMPSGDAYRVITEDVMNIEEYKSHPYFPIVVSAGRAEGDDFRRTLTEDRFVKRGVVIGINVGKDYLVVNGSKHAIHSSCINSPKSQNQDSTISVRVLKTLIKQQDSLLRVGDLVNPKIGVYTTNINSGTLNAYIGLLNTVTDTITGEVNVLSSYIRVCNRLKKSNKQYYDSLKYLKYGHVFYGVDEISILSSNNEWISLGSKYYGPQDKGRLSLSVLDENGDNVYKSIYIYFMLYKDKGLYRLPEATRQFLTKIGVEDIDIILSVNDSVCDNRVLYDNYKLEFLKKKKN
jgi:hypothetical protein